MTSIHFAGKTRDNQDMYYSQKKFQQLSHSQKALIAEALPNLIYNRHPHSYTFSFDRLVGLTSLVEVEDYQKDKVVWVYRKRNHKWKIPAFLGRSSKWTTYLTLFFQQIEGKVFIIDCYLGKRTPPMPCNPIAIKRGNAFVEECQSFWQNHALAIPLDDIDISRTLKTLSGEEATRFLEYLSIYA